MDSGVYLSIVLTGRNDNYGGDFTSRLLRTTRFNYTALRDAGVSAEIVFVEWNPVAGKPPLVDVVREELSDLTAGAFRGYVVDPAYHPACALHPTMQYLEYVAKNIGIRRARGEMVLVTNTDIYFSRGCVDALAARYLRREVVYRAARIDIAMATDQTRVTWETLEEPASHARRPTLHPPLFAGGSGDFLLLDRASWHALRGFNEIHRAARVGVDHNFLVKAYGCGYEITDIGAPVYHVNHPGSYRISKNLVSESAGAAAWGARRWHSRHVVYENSDQWGLGEAPERLLAAGARYLAFDWKAVAPMVELRRVVLPMRRAAAADE